MQSKTLFELLFNIYSLIFNYYISGPGTVSELTLDGNVSYIGKNNVAYEGEYSNNAPNGFGKLQFSGGVFVGNFLNGVLHGQASELSVDNHSKVIFSGNFNMGMRDGFGVETIAHGTSECVWKNNVPSPIGTIRYTTGQVYVGELNRKGRDSPEVFWGALTGLSGVVQTGEWVGFDAHGVIRFSFPPQHPIKHVTYTQYTRNKMSNLSINELPDGNVTYSLFNDKTGFSPVDTPSEKLVRQGKEIMGRWRNGDQKYKQRLLSQLNTDL